MVLKQTVGLVKSIHDGVYNYTDGNKNNANNNRNNNAPAGSKLLGNNFPSDPSFPSNDNNLKKMSTASIVITVVIILSILIVGLGPILRSYYLSAVCNHGNMEQFLKEFAILFFLSFLWMPNVVYCFWKSGNCNRKPKLNRKK